MRFTVESQGTGSFLVYSMAEDEVVDSVSMGMIDNNQIEGIIPFQRVQVDAHCYLKYNISSKISLAKYFNGVVNRQRLISVMDSIASTVLNAAEFMLEPGAFVWDKEYIFVDVSTAKAHLICVPMVSKGGNDEVNLEQFLRQLLLGVDYDQSENCDYVARLLGFFNSKRHFGLNDFRKTLAMIGGSPSAPSRYTPSQHAEIGHRTGMEGEFGGGNVPGDNPGSVLGNGVAVEEYPKGKSEESGSGDEPAGEGGSKSDDGMPKGGGTSKGNGMSDEGGTTAGDAVVKKDMGILQVIRDILNWGKPEKSGKGEKPGAPGFGTIRIPGRDSGPVSEAGSLSQCLGQDEHPVLPETSDEVPMISPTVDDFPGPEPFRKKLFLEQSDTGKRIPVQRFPFEIGRDGSGLTIDMSRKMVSRQHAVITETEDGFAIRDISKHGTFLDGRRILYDVDTPLKDGMKVLLKEVEFTVVIEEG